LPFCWNRFCPPARKKSKTSWKKAKEAAIFSKSMINAYEFGKITVDGKVYEEDIVIGADGKVGLWVYETHHLADKKSVEPFVGEDTEAAVIGSGESGLMEAPPETMEYFKSKKIETFILPTAEAAKKFNELNGKKKTVAFMHLTC